MKIVVLDGATVNPGDLSWQALEQLGDLTVYPATPPELSAERIQQAQAVFTNKVPLTEEIFAACPQLRWVGVLATGYNIIDTDAAARRNIPVCNVPSYSTAAVAQYVFALLLHICSHVAEHNEAVQQGQWQQSGAFSFWNYPLIELAGKTMGIIGFGRIGNATASIAQAMGMRVLACGSSGKPGPAQNGAQIVSLEELLAGSDIVSLHCPLLPSTQGLINRDTIAKMRDGAILINTSRGPLVNEADLRQALESGKLYAAGLDVAAQEPIAPNSPLLGAKNCFITPHVAWAATETRRRLLDTSVENLRSYMGGQTINAVNL